MRLWHDLSDKASSAAPLQTTIMTVRNCTSPDSTALHTPKENVDRSHAACAGIVLVPSDTNSRDHARL